MTYPKKEYDLQKHQVLWHEKQRVLIWPEFKPALPLSDIHAEPYRCLRVNEDWWPLIAGFVMLLADVQAWPDAEDERYTGIQQIMKLLRESECNSVVEDIRLNNCIIEKLVGGQWIAVGDVNACITAITNPIQNQVTTNTNNISQNANQINTNTIAIGDLQLDAQQKTLTLADHENRIDALELDASQQALTLVDHENRIDTLEAASGSGASSGVVKITTYTLELSGANIALDNTWKQIMLVSHNFTLPNALIHHEYQVIANSGSTTYARQQVGATIGLQTTKVQGGVWVSAECNNVFSIIPGQLDIELQITEISGVTSVAGNQTIHLVVTEFANVLAGQALVTFDGDTYPYTLPAFPNQVGQLSSGGNPDMCVLAQSVNDGDALIVEIDLGEPREILDIQADVFAANISNTGFIWFLDTNLQTQVNLVGNNNQWQTFAAAQQDFPVVGQLIVFQYAVISGSQAEIRMDNINIILGD